MIEVIQISLLIAAAAYLSYPLLKPRATEKREPRPNSKARELEAQKESLLAAIKEIDFDHRTGKLSDEDFQALNTRYRLEAISLIKRLDQLKGRGGAKPDFEEEIRRYRRQTQGGEAAEAAPRVYRCPKCNRPVGKQDRFCANCGFKL